MSKLKRKGVGFLRRYFSEIIVIGMVVAFSALAIWLPDTEYVGLSLGLVLAILILILFKISNLESFLENEATLEADRYMAERTAREAETSKFQDDISQQETRLRDVIQPTAEVPDWSPVLENEKDEAENIDALAPKQKYRTVLRETKESVGPAVATEAVPESFERGTSGYLDEIESVLGQAHEAPNLGGQEDEDDISDNGELLFKENTKLTGKSFEISKDETIVSVSYATNRNKENDPDSPAGVHFGSGIGDLQYGRAHVSIPKKHKVGHLERPRFWQVFTKEKIGKHVVFRALDESSEDDFFARLGADIKETDGQRAFVFVHGFNTNFLEGVRRAAQMAFDLFGIGRDEDGMGKLSLVPIYFSWPSNGNAVSYITDTNRAEASIETFRLFLEDVSRRTGVEELTVIAHSMGNQLLTKALKRIGDQMRAGDVPFLKEIILAAPDIDERVFLDLIDGIKKTGNRITLYASENDKALKLSKKINGFKRAGDASSPITIFEGGDTIDASSVGEDVLAHTYVAETTVLQDLYNMILNGHPPAKRFGLMKAKASAKTYWRIKTQ